MAVLTFPGVSAVVLGIFLIVVLRRGLSQDRDIPGPFLARFSRLWYMRQMIRGDFQYTNIRLHQDHGKIVRIAPGWYSFSDPEALKTIYTHGSKFIKSDWYAAWNFSPNPEENNMFSYRNSADHPDARRKVAALFSMSAVMAYEPYVNNCIERLRVQFDSFSETGSMIDLGHWLQCFAFDTISEITFGERFGFLDRGDDVSNPIANLEKGFVASSLTGLMLWLRPLVTFLSKLQETSDLMFVPQFVDRKISEYSQEAKREIFAEKTPGMLERLLDAMRDGGKGMTNHDVKANSSANIGAGSDTTAIGLSAVVIYMYRSPEKLQKLREEIESSNLGQDSSFQELQKSSYLQAAIKESMRLHPGVGFPLFRLVPRGGAVICDRFFPEGANVGVNSWVIHRDRNIWGPDVDDFVPERWLSADNTRLKVMEQLLVPFGAGSRTCLGKNISLFDINKLLLQLVQNYDIEIQQREGKDKRAYNMWFVKPNQLKAKISKRVSKSGK
ncbi:cytochrome P450 [Aspergillus ellipticus CBS 707.79]|uniref:Cytochrome P450 n=1 Tax=Aspergillus ellipticus CBS 707.79 TaxID=1448320 RepID=A0A319D7I0_9EURO|nr:cytochrome P450 [Aspergillus ellipticus CBS 707.79]